MSGLPLDLTPWLNATVATLDGERPRGALNAWGNSFPAEELPFGSTLTVGGILFQLPPRNPGGPDSVEPLGQALEVPGAPEAAGIALLCCGEMGDQRAPVRVLDSCGEAVADFVAVARGAMVPAGADLREEGFAASHLHYPGDYDLALALPALWRVEHRWGSAKPVARVELGCNPLFHLLAITLLDPGEA
ncbi:MAG TPA: hypothetical protein VFR03_10815 [Thermoanaerobaculia bacterium]|nr:hypothetical protein [Thermoanaerobaculia bacterium]